MNNNTDMIYLYSDMESIMSSDISVMMALTNEALTNEIMCYVLSNGIISIIQHMIYMIYGVVWYDMTHVV